MPFILGWSAGPNLSLTSRPDVNHRASHIACDVYLKDEADLEKYLPHPEQYLRLRAPTKRALQVPALSAPAPAAAPK